MKLQVALFVVLVAMVVVAAVLLWQPHKPGTQSFAQQSPRESEHSLSAVDPPAAVSAPSTASAVAVVQSTNTDKNVFGKFFSRMMDNPVTEQFVRDQQRVAVSHLYDPLIKLMKLGPAESERFKDLLTDRTMRGSGKGALPSGGTSATNQIISAEDLAAVQKGFDDQIRELLGETRYAQFKDYEQTAAERLQLNLFRQQAGGSNRALTDAQAEQLLSFIKEEKQSLIATGQPLPTIGQDPLSAVGGLSEEQSNQFLQGQQNVNQRVYARARAILSPEQLDAFALFQANQLEMLRTSLSMARSVLGADKR